jgi:hypothetical protein
LEEGVTARRLPLLLLALTLAGLTLAGSAATAPPPAPPGPSCSPAPASCFGWHTSNVTVSWAAPPPGVSANCPSVTISNDTGGTPVSCTWSNAEGSRTTTANVRRDASPPTVTGTADRRPDANGWYNRGVTVRFSGEDSASGIASCSSGGYSGPDTASASVSGGCTNGAGLTGGASVPIAYDATPPSVEAKPERQPDANGWYNHAITIAFRGSDPVSGLESCAAPVLYQGPDAPKASLSGTCRDKAANTSPRAAFELKYDTKPPTLGRVRVEIASKGVTLRWNASKDSLSFAVVRRPGLRGKKPSTVYQGGSRAFIDRRLKAGIKYRYTVTAYDQAGNAAAKVLQAQPGHSVNEPARTKPAATKPAATKPALARPAQGARVAKPPLLTWGDVPEATYYNVQLYRAGKKILTVWVRHPKFRLQASWKYGGRTFRLSPGRYRWYVWPGAGPPSANRYGKLLGTRSFVVIRP